MVVMTSSLKESLVQYEGDPYSSDSSDDQDCPGNQGHLKEGILSKRKDDISDQPTVVWKETLFSFLASLHRNVGLSDLVVHCKDGKLPAHRVILASSEMLASLLRGEVADIYLPDFSMASVLLALNFVYKGSASAALESELMFGNFSNPEVQGVDLLCSSPLLLAASVLQDWLLQFANLNMHGFTILHNNNQLLL